jgi:DNA-binding transcriptional MerR regulator/effector-binding domain-containing protein
MLGIGDFARLGQVSPRTLRHYADLGLLEPARVDQSTGYRYYSVEQLAELHRVIALRELGIGLDAIRKLIADHVPIEQLRGMLRLRRAEISEAIDAEHERLRRVEAHLDAIEIGAVMDTIDIVIKCADALRIAAFSGRVGGYGYENINPFFQAHLQRVSEQLVDQGLRFGPCVAYYEEDGDDVIVHLGWEIGDQEVEETDGIRVHELPAIEVASAVHRGSMVEVTSIFEAMVRWIDAAGYQLIGNGRELYWQLDFDETKQVTEIQLPIAASAATKNAAAE